MKKIAIFFKNSQSKRCLRACSWGELARLHGLARLGEVIFIPHSYGIFYLTAKSLLRHRKKIVLITWLLSRKFYIFNMEFRRLQQLHLLYTVLWIWSLPFLFFCNFMGFSLVLLILDFTYLVVLAVTILKSNLERIPKICMHFKEKSITPCRACPHVHMTNFCLT